MEEKSIDKEKERVVINPNGKKYLVKDYRKGFSAKEGILTSEQLETSGKKTTNLGSTFFVLKPNFSDTYNFLKRGAQIMSKKDIGQIIIETNIGKDSLVVDAGSGSGFFSVAVGNIVKKLVTYDIKEQHTELVKKNIERAELKNVTAKIGDIYDEKQIKEKDVDLLNLDVPEPHNALKSAEKILKSGGFLTAYNPSILQSKKLVEELINNEHFIYLKTIEIIKRDWVLDGKKSRPSFEGLGHTGFIVIARKI